MLARSKPRRRRDAVVRASSGLCVEALERRSMLAVVALPASRETVVAPPAFVATAMPPADLQAPVSIVAPRVSSVVQKGPIVHAVVSPYQRAATRIRVLLPDTYDPTRTYRTIYILPVEPGNGSQFGDGLRVVQQANLHNLHQAVFVAPSFTDMPWYADHVSNGRVRQESHVVRFVIPFIEQRYSVSRLGADRLLLGFSKSGYGAFSMLLRNPETFGKAFAWDSPVGMTNPATGWDYLKVLGSQANFEKYRIPTLLTHKAALLAGQPPRLILSGYSYGFTRSDHAKIAALMTSLRIPHVYDPGTFRSHVWHSGWVPNAVAQLLSRG